MKSCQKKQSRRCLADFKVVMTLAGIPPIRLDNCIPTLDTGQSLATFDSIGKVRCRG